MESIDQTNTLSFNTPRDSNFINNHTYRKVESGLKNASIAGIVSTPRLGVLQQPITHIERVKVDTDDTSKPKAKKLTTGKISITPDKSKTLKTMSAKNSRENPNHRSAKNITQSIDNQTKTISKTAKTP